MLNGMERIIRKQIIIEIGQHFLMLAEETKITNGKIRDFGGSIVRTQSIS